MCLDQTAMSVHIDNKDSVCSHKVFFSFCFCAGSRPAAHWGTVQGEVEGACCPSCSLP